MKIFWHKVKGLSPESHLMVYAFIFFTMLMHLWGGQVPHFFKTLITSSAAVAESGQRNSQLRKSIFWRSKKNLASELTANGFYGDLSSVCSEVCVARVLRIIFSSTTTHIPPSVLILLQNIRRIYGGG